MPTRAPGRATRTISASAAGRASPIISKELGELMVLRFDCLRRDAQGGWEMIYYQPKVKRDLTIPITRELAGMIIEQR